MRQKKYDNGMAPVVYLIGIGMGGPDQLTGQALDCLKNVQAVMGADRMLESVEELTQGRPILSAYRPSEMVKWLSSFSWNEAALVLSGDTGFYSGAETAGRAFAREGWDVEYIPGISSLSYFCARLGKSWQNVHALSLHGRDADLTAHVRMHKSCFVILGEPGEAAKLCRELVAAGLGNVRVWAGENFSYENERITWEMTPAELATRVLTLSSFHLITQDDYRILLRHLIKIGHIDQTENGGLIVGLEGERIVNNYKFYAVFQENVEYAVRAGAEELGTIVKPPPIGDKIAIAGRVWVVEEVDHRRREVYCTLVKGNIPAYFGDVAGDIHTRILERMYGVLKEQNSYPYLMRHAVCRLQEARESFAKSGMRDHPLVHLGGNMWALFPWLGSYAFLALERLLKIRCKQRLGLKGLDSLRPYYLQFTMKVSASDFYRIMAEEAEQDFDPLELVYPNEVPNFEKYDEYVPAELVRKGFALGVLDVEGMKQSVRSWSRYVKDN